MQCECLWLPLQLVRECLWSRSGRYTHGFWWMHPLYVYSSSFCAGLKVSNCGYIFICVVDTHFLSRGNYMHKIYTSWWKGSLKRWGVNDIKRRRRWTLTFLGIELLWWWFGIQLPWRYSWITGFSLLNKGVLICDPTLWGPLKPTYDHYRPFSHSHAPVIYFTLIKPLSTVRLNLKEI